MAEQTLQGLMEILTGRDEGRAQRPAAPVWQIPAQATWEGPGRQVLYPRNTRRWAEVWPWSWDSRQGTRQPLCWGHPYYRLGCLASFYASYGTQLECYLLKEGYLPPLGRLPPPGVLPSREIATRFSGLPLYMPSEHCTYSMHCDSVNMICIHVCCMYVPQCLGQCLAHCWDSMNNY